MIFTTAFFAALALWNLRWPGVALGGVVIFVALGVATALGRNFPILLAHWKTDTPIKAVVRFAFCLTCCVGGYYFILGGTFADRERNLFLYRDTANFAKEYTGKEYQLLRLLPSYQHTVPQVELIDAYARPTYASMFFRNGVFDLSADPADINFRLFLGFWLLGSGVVVLFVGGGRMLKPNRSWRVWIWPATLLLAIIVGWWACGFMQALLGMVQLGSTLSGSEPLKCSMNDARQPLQACLASHGYAPADMNMYSMSRIPDGEKIGFAGVENFVKPSPFDRWHWPRGRLVPTQPAVQLFYVTTAWQPPDSYGLPPAAATAAPHPETYVMWTIYGTSLDQAAAYGFNDQLHAVVEAGKSPATQPTAASEPTIPAAHLADSRIEIHGTKRVPATHDELVHILSELPKPFTQELTGSAEQEIKDLGTKVWVFDFDRGPASFWTGAYETGQQTFPERLPAPSLGAVWRVENPKAHILMWIQPREEIVEMGEATLSSVRKRSDDLPDYAMGIDVDGKSVLRQTHNPGLSKPQIPLWFGWMNRELQESSGAINFDPKTGILHDRNQAMVFIRADKAADGARAGTKIPSAATVKFGLWYLADNAPPMPATRPAVDHDTK